MVEKRHHVFVLALLALPLLHASGAHAANQVRVESETLLRWFQQEREDGDKKTGVPIYEYLRFDAGALTGDGFSAHFYGWGRYDLGNYYDDNSAGEVLYGYVQYARAEGNVLVRVGRQFLLGNGGTDDLDGALASADVTPYFALSGYVGQPVAMEIVDGRKGDLLWGGRVAHHLRGLYEVGVAYKRQNNDGDKDTEFLSIDSSFTPPWPVSFFGYSRRNLVTDGWAEHSYEGRLSLAGFVVRPYFQQFRTEDFLDDGSGTPKVFKDVLFFSGEETVAILGGDASWRSARGLELGAKVKHYDYRDADATSWYYAGTLVQHWAETTEVGGEVGRMQGDRDQDRYTTVGGHFYVDKVPYGGQIPLFLSGDVLYAHYDREVQGKSHSLFASLGGGVKLAGEAVKVKLSGSYSSDPYFDADFRMVAALEYAFEK